MATSLKAVRKYNEKTYDVLSVRIKKELLKEFKEKCKKEGISQASIVNNAIEEFLKNKR